MEYTAEMRDGGIDMCVGLSAKVVKISDGTAVVDAGGAKREVSAQLLGDLEPGDYVMVHAGVAIAKITDDDEEETYRVVTSVRADILEGLVSNVSPIGKAILGHKVGDRVQVVPERGDPYFITIRKIENTHDDGSFEIN